MRKELPREIAESARVMAECGWSGDELLRALVYIYAGSVPWCERLKIAWSAFRR